MAAGAAAPLILGTTSVGAQGNADFTTGNYTGRACGAVLQGVKLAVLALPDQCLGDSGALPAAGGNANGPTGPISVAGLLTANVLVSAANGQVVAGVGPNSTAASKVAGVTVLPGAGGSLPALPLLPGIIPALPGVTSDLVDVTLLSANTSVNCTSVQDATKTVVAAITIAGSPINITGAPNQVITIPAVGTITLNRQVYDAGTNTATGEAVVLDLNVLGLVTGHIALAHAESDLSGCSGGGAAVPKTAGLPPTGSLSSSPDVAGGSQTTGLGVRRAILPVGATAIVAGGLAVAWRRRRELAHADKDGS